MHSLHREIPCNPNKINHPRTLLPKRRGCFPSHSPLRPKRTGVDQMWGAFRLARVQCNTLPKPCISAHLNAFFVFLLLWWVSSVEAQMPELITAFADDLVVFVPRLARAGQHIDVGLRLPVRVRLAAVRIAERQMPAREFFVLQQPSNHFREAQVGAEGQFADAVAIFV